LLAAVKENTPDEMPVVLTPQFRTRDDGAWNVEVDEDGDFHVVGKRFERMVAMTDLDNRDAVRYLVRRLKRLGVVERLQELGIQEGDTVFLGGEEFSFADW
jgi:GTP-binding protein